MTNHQSDFLVIGGGIAGLTFALEAANRGDVLLITKRSINEGATPWAQGGIATAWSSSDSWQAHYNDTIATGCGLTNQAIAELTVREGKGAVQRLIDLGTAFDRVNGSDEYHLTQEGGHSARRVLHTADQTGAEIHRALLAAVRAHPRIKILENHLAIDLITSHKLGLDEHRPNRVLGAFVLGPTNDVVVLRAERVLIATGGAGKVYLYTSNPDVATGDGIALCFRAGVAVANLEFFQFHPTCLFHPEAKSFLITEAMRGEGARLLTARGEPFMQRYDPRKELAPRDIVARAIDHHLKSSGDDYVLLDITSRSATFIREHFPAIHQRCLKFGFDITSQPIPVVPAAHYCVGGVICDEHGATSIQNLYVAGEVAHSGLHGANRLASNSLLEGAVFGKRAAIHACREPVVRSANTTMPDWNAGDTRDSDEQVVISQLWDEIRRTMWNYVGIVRSTKRLERALRRSSLIENETTEYYWNFRVNRDLLELRNLSLVANLTIHCALRRRESRGLHYTVDYPEPRALFQRDTVIEPAEWFHFEKVGAYRH